MSPSAGSWRRAGPQDLSGVLEFLLPQVWRAVPFTSRLLREGRPALPSRVSSAVAVLEAGTRGSPAIRGAILRTAGGLLLPVMPYAPGSTEERREALGLVPRPEASLPRLLAGDY